jgi:hypothetical protein
MRRNVRSQGLERSVRIRSHGTYHVEDNEAIWDNGGTAWTEAILQRLCIGCNGKERAGQGRVGFGQNRGKRKINVEAGSRSGHFPAFLSV